MQTTYPIVRRHVSAASVVLIMLLLAVFRAPPASAQGPHILHNFNPPPFDFTDRFYRQNGIKPHRIQNRTGPEDTPDNEDVIWATDDSNTDPTRRNVRILETTGGFDKDGNLIYYSIMGSLDSHSFTNNAAGLRAMMLAEQSRAFLFPKTPRLPDGRPGDVLLSPAPPNRRQDNIFDTKAEYFCQNLLGLWIVSFVIYTQEAFTPAGQRVLAPIARRNGIDLDGTPLLKTVAEIEHLLRHGLVEIRVNEPAGEDGPRWVI